MYKLFISVTSFMLFFPFYSHSEIRSNLRAESLNFLSSDYTATPKNFNFIGAHVKSYEILKKLDSEGEKKADTFSIDLKANYAVGNSVLSYTNLKEVYYTYEIDDISKIQVGRKLHDWSLLDQTFSLGLTQPVFKWNQMMPESQGLSGFFWTRSEESFQMTLFASPLFIPDQGASYEIKDGQFQSGNPFFQAPPQNIRFQGQLLPIDYEINKPETTEVVFQSLLGAQIKIGESKGYFLNASALFKPSHQLALGYKGVLVTTRVRIDVTPKTYTENVYAFDIGTKEAWGSVVISGVYSKARNPEFESPNNSPTFEPTLFWGPHAVLNFRPFSAYLAYVDSQGASVTDVGPDASPDRASLSERFLFKQLTQIGLKYSDVFLKQFKIDSDLSFQFSSKEGFRKILFRNSIDFRGPWTVWMDLLLIDTDSSVLSNFEAYKNQDQIWLGVGYDL